jgi:hypothetical protein
MFNIAFYLMLVMSVIFALQVTGAVPTQFNTGKGSEFGISANWDSKLPPPQDMTVYDYGKYLFGDFMGGLVIFQTLAIIAVPAAALHDLAVMVGINQYLLVTSSISFVDMIAGFIELIYATEVIGWLANRSPLF